MKKLIAFVLLLCMLFTMVACSTGEYNNDNREDNGNDDESSVTENNGGDQSNTNGENHNKIDLDRITDITEFHEGKAFARYGNMTSDEYRTVYCIDKTGKILFTLNDISAGDEIAGFYNGLAALTVFKDNQVTVCLCNDKGEIIKPEDVGATGFLIDPDSANSQTVALFADGYIFVEKTETDFSGSSAKAAVLNSDLEVIVEYSEQLYQLYERFIYSSYYGGYLYDTWDREITEALDLNTGKLVEDLSTLVSAIQRENESDLWYYGEDGCYYDLLTGEKKVDLSKYNETIFTTFPFASGVAPILFKSADKYFFTIVKEDGSFCFEPAEIKGYDPTVKVNGDKFLVLSAVRNDYYLETFDSSGKLGEATLQLEGRWMSASISDEIVIVADHGSNTKQFYYTLDLQPLSW